MPSVLSHLKSGGWDIDAADIADQDPTYAELSFNRDDHGSERWLILSRCNRECPADLVECFKGMGALEDGSIWSQ